MDISVNFYLLARPDLTNNHGANAEIQIPTRVKRR